MGFVNYSMLLSLIKTTLQVRMEKLFLLRHLLLYPKEMLWIEKLCRTSLSPPAPAKSSFFNSLPQY
jgi:hypothetical protein